MRNKGRRGCIVDSDVAGLLAVSIIFSAIAIVEAQIISPIFYSMAGVILAMLGYLVLSDRVGGRREKE
ncbi:MAG TPA: hypothetical protein VD736_05935 [Nitrososphaera sp.]|nr:hypothetical protein [Nitrososphaera sp.]